MTYPICSSCAQPKYGASPPEFVGTLVCRCEPYIPVMDRGHPDTSATEIQRLLDLVASLGREIAKLRAAIEYTLPIAEDDWYHEHLVLAGVNSQGSRAVEMMRKALATEPKP